MKLSAEIVRSMTDQQIFEFVSTHLFTQGRPARTGTTSIYEGQCRYRLDDDNLKCAVGALIPDELYSEHLEGKNFKTVLDYTSHAIPKLFTLLHSREVLLRDLQILHDTNCNWWSPDNLRDALRIVGRNHDLSVDFLSTLTFPSADTRLLQEVPTISSSQPEAAPAESVPELEPV